MTRYEEARQAMSGALSIRRSIGASLDCPLSIVDAALQLGIHVSFDRLASVEGMWCRERRAIILTSLRPVGRRAFTCAHEIGHAHFNHGTAVDELIEYTPAYANSPEERLANYLAGHLLMPPYGLPFAVQERGWQLHKLSVTQAYTLASLFGVSYGALLNHFHYSLNLIEFSAFTRLMEPSPKNIRATLCPEVDGPHLLVVDKLWAHRPIDLDVGDVALLPRNSIIEGDLLEDLGIGKVGARVAKALKPGLGRLTNLVKVASLPIRVSPREFRGFGEYRFPACNNVYSTTASHY